MKYISLFVLISLISFSAQSIEEKQYRIETLEKQEVVLNEIVFLYQLGKIRKVAFNESSFETIKKIDEIILLIISDNLIYQPELNKEYADQVIEFLQSAKYHKFTWSVSSHEKLVNALKDVER
ncbi:MAG: hypothetical protein ABJV04_04695 [Aliiglaciecola sp.]|uniref:hypothetical protein n=1 Tax=Aliiglaciecola sp. TaxID=1872441 RepID=UPI00329A7779